jgi:hypothetical protein
MQLNCFVYFTHNSVYFIHGNYNYEKKVTEFIHIMENLIKNKEIVNKDKLKVGLFPKNFELTQINFYTNISIDTNFYKLLWETVSKNNCCLSSNSFLSEEQLKFIYFKFVDGLIGDNICFSGELLKKKIENYINNSNESEIDNSLIPYLYFFNYISIAPQCYPALGAMEFYSG